MRRISRIVYPLVLLLLLSSCSSQSNSAENNKDFKMTIPPLEESTTCSKDNSGKVMCVFEFEITSIADSPKSLSGEFFAVADEKIYLADDSPNISNSISGTSHLLVPLNQISLQFFLDLKDHHRSTQLF